MSISRRRLITGGAAAAAGLALGRLGLRADAALPTPATGGPFQPTWDSLAQYQTPDWFRDAKFGMWAHWGPQCQPGQGDWYARQMYQEGNRDYNYQVAHYGHPSKAGFKDVIHQWKAEEWDPEHLIGLYKGAGAKYFMCLANHHDNLDNYNSKYQTWNSVAVGPKKDIVGGWEKAVRAAGLRFAVSVHAAHAWSWYETSQGADKTGPLAGVPYDGHLTKADGKGLWWEGLDPQELYAQNHAPMGLEWEWNNRGRGDLPSAAYTEKFYNRIMDLIDTYHPDQVYFDDTVLPLYPITDVGLRIAANFYNRNMKRHGGRLEAVVNGKILSEQQRKCLVWDLERGYSDRIEPLPWQTDTCIGDWHYSLPLFERHGYKKPDQVAHMLVDIVSKNGNLMLNIPLPGSGKPDTDELAFLADFKKWMDVSGEGIYATRPWHVFGEGPAGGGPATRAQGFNEGNRKYTPQDFRFTRKGDTLYAFAMAWPEDGKLLVRSLAQGAGQVQDVSLLGHRGKLAWTQTASGLALTLPAQKPCDYVYGLRIAGRGLTPVALPAAPIVLAPVAVIVQPQASGVVVLTATTATLHGSSPQVENKGGIDDIGYWGTASDSVSWEFTVPAPGTYTVTASYSCDTPAAGASFRVEAGGQSMTGKTISTGSWDTFASQPLGPLTLAQSGRQTLSFKPQATPAWIGIALRSVTLTPVAATTTA